MWSLLGAMTATQLWPMPLGSEYLHPLLLRVVDINDDPLRTICIVADLHERHNGLLRFVLVTTIFRTMLGEIR
jgi:hypothetical protein